MAEKKTILIIGGFGFIGSNILDRFLASGNYRVIVFEFMNVVPKRKSHAEEAKVYYGDFNNAKDLEQVFAENSIDIVMHLISTTVPASSNANIVFDIQTNLVDTVRLLELMKQFKVGKLAYLSSGGTVYGEPQTLPIKEGDPTNPICSYGITKLAIEKYLHLFQYLHGIQYLILRPSNPYGPYHTSTKQGLINVMLRKIIAGEPITIWGDGHIVRDYMYVSDLAEAAYRMIDGERWGNIVNVGFGKGYSIRDLLAIMKRAFPAMEVVYQPSRSFDIENLVLDTDRMNSLCDVPVTGLEEGIRKTLDWMVAEAEGKA